MSVFSPGDEDQALDREIELIETAVRDRERIDVTSLARTIGARSWGPGRFRTALREAVAEGRVVRESRRIIAVPEDGGSGS
jgi:hypothetical protein